MTAQEIISFLLESQDSQQLVRQGGFPDVDALRKYLVDILMARHLTTRG